MTQFESVALVGFPLVTSIATIWYSKQISKPETAIDIKKKQAEFEVIMTEYWKGIIDELKKQIDFLTRKIEYNEKEQERIQAYNKKIQEHDRAVIKSLRKAKEDLLYSQSVMELEIKYIHKNNTQLITWLKRDVFLLDDDIDTLEEFHSMVSKISLISLHGFSEINTFLAAVRSRQPPIVIIDYRLDDGKTAEDVIKELGYEPEIFIISANVGFEERFFGQPIKFFVKEERYVNKIAQEIVKYLTDKI